MPLWQIPISCDRDWCFAIWARATILRRLKRLGIVRGRHGDEHREIPGLAPASRDSARGAQGDEERDEDHGDEGEEGHPGEDSDEDHVHEDDEGEDSDEDHVHEGDEGQEGEDR